MDRNRLRKLMPAICCAALLAASQAGALAQTNAVAPPRFLCRFSLQGYPLTAESGAVINQIVTDLLHRHEQAFGFTAGTNFQVRIRIFGRQQEFLTYARTNRFVSSAEGQAGPAANGAKLAGYYSAGGHEVVTWRQRDPSYLANNILHECSHAIMAEQFHNLPVWLSEGCAVYFSFPQQVRDAEDARTLKLRWESLGYWLEHGKLPQLSAFLNLSPDDFRGVDPVVAYTTSWSVFQFLMSTPENRKAMNQLVAELQNAEPVSTDCAKILNGAYPGGLAKFESAWHAWIKRGAAAVEVKETKTK